MPRSERVADSSPPPSAGIVDLSAARPAGRGELVRAALSAATDDVVASMDYSPFGLVPLRSAIADHLTAAGLATRPQEVLVTSGAQQAIGLACDLLVRAGDTVVVEAPTYPGAIDAFARAGARLVFVPADDPLVIARALGGSARPPRSATASASFARRSVTAYVARPAGPSRARLRTPAAFG